LIETGRVFTGLNESARATDAVVAAIAAHITTRARNFLKVTPIVVTHQSRVLILTLSNASANRRFVYRC